jgi:hypothetical protein
LEQRYFVVDEQNTENTAADLFHKLGVTKITKHKHLHKVLVHSKRYYSTKSKFKQTLSEYWKEYSANISGGALGGVIGVGFGITAAKQKEEGLRQGAETIKLAKKKLYLDGLQVNANFNLKALEKKHKEIGLIEDRKQRIAEKKDFFEHEESYKKILSSLDDQEKKHADEYTKLIQEFKKEIMDQFSGE